MANVRAIAAELGHCIVEYFVRQTELVSWVVHPTGQVYCTRHPVSATDLIDAVTQLDWLIERRSTCESQEVIGISHEITDVLHKLSTYLWHPLEKFVHNKSHITIVPHLHLFRVPFAGLTDHVESPVLRRHILTFVPALSLLTHLLHRQRPDARDGNLIALVDPAPMPLPGLPPLTWTQTHFHHVANLFPASKRKVLIGRQATLDRLRQSAQRPGVVVFATHAQAADTHQPSVESFVALAPTDRHDGLLRIDDVSGIGLDATLVILSACYSGSGRITGDGVLGLSRAFLIEGAPSLVLTLHKVIQEVSLELIHEFLDRWLQGARMDEAFQQAQLHLIEEFTTDPAAWMPFVLYGTGQ